ncbi:hypothetical protein AAF712_013529 [Marasmius tenuissimus]|uniref:F-box domain-containing protein n=1 Tax=Marasmius tenuissimus TaxID=585030 RepID=A0ABR2ZG35_9AGAR
MHSDVPVPLELADAILKYCEKQTLLACSLVCKAWLPLCRPRIFKRVTFNMRRRDSRKRCRELVRMEAIAVYIRSLSLSLSLLEDVEEDSDEETSDNKENDHTIQSLDIMMRDLSQLKGSLKSLQALTITSNEFEFEDCLLCDESLVDFLKPLRRYPIVPRLLSIFADIVDLSLVLESEDLESVLTFICSFPQLRVLRTNTYHFATYRQQLPLPTCVLPLTLRSFHLEANDGDGESTPDFYHWVSTHPLRQIVLFSITNFYDQSDRFSPSLEPYMTGLCSETKSLHLSFDLQEIDIQASSGEKLTAQAHNYIHSN